MRDAPPDSSGNSMLTSCVSSSAKITPVNGDRMVPPRIAPMLNNGQKPSAFVGKNMVSIPPSAPPIISSGASTPPDVPDPSEIAQIADFTSRMPSNQLQRHVTLQQRADGFISHAQRLRKNQSAQSDRQAADGRPPHPVNRQLAESILRCIDGQRQQRRKPAAASPTSRHRSKPLRADEDRLRRASETAARGQ